MPYGPTGVNPMMGFRGAPPMMSQGPPPPGMMNGPPGMGYNPSMMNGPPKGMVTMGPSIVQSATPIFVVPSQTTTVYVGKIPPGVEDDFIRKLLEQCGKVSNWRRVADPVSGKLKGFGFCDYENPEGVLRALKILGSMKLDGGELLLKVDDKTQRLLADYTARKAKALGKTENGATKDIEEERSREAVRIIILRRDRGEDYRNYEYDPSRVRPDELLDDKTGSIKGETDKWRERNSRDDRKDTKKEREETEEEKAERERRNRAEKERETEREREREQRKKEREEREYRDREKEWEGREYIKEKEREKERDRERREKDRELRDSEYDDFERKKRTKEYEKKKREREKEREEDEAERLREYQEEEESKRKEQIKKEGDTKRKTVVQQQKMQKAFRIPHLPSVKPPPPPELFTGSPPDIEGLDRSKLSSFALPTTTSKDKPVISVVPGFNAEPEVDELYVKKKRKLVTLESALHEESDRKAKLEQLKNLIETIPTKKEELFGYNIDWQIIDQNVIIEKKMRPWITKKIVEYLGEEEKTLIDFIINKLIGHTAPNEILEQLLLVLDEEAEVFIVKLWRMLIFETLIVNKSSSET